MKNWYFFLCFLPFMLASCIGDDIIMDEVDETLRITNPIDTIGPAQTYQLELRYTNNVGEIIDPDAIWESSDPSSITVDNTGFLTAVGDGSSTITVSVELPDAEILTESLEIAVGIQEETLSFLNPLDTLAKDETYQLELRYTDNLGQVVPVQATWNSSNPAVLTVDGNGLLTGVSLGSALVTATVVLPDASTLEASANIVVDEETTTGGTVRTGTIMTTSSYELAGQFEITETDDGIQIDIAADYVASTALPGLYVYLGNNPNSIGNALEIQAVQVFSGAHSYEIEGVGINDYDYLLYWCKPFGVKVGEGKIN